MGKSFHALQNGDLPSRDPLRTWLYGTGIRTTFIVILMAVLASPRLVIGQDASSLSSLPLSDMEFRLIGPFRGGRSIAVVGHPTERLTFYFGSTGGGVWKTVDAGHNWINVSDGYFKTGSVGALALAPSQPETVYAGMGEHAIRGNTSHGDGVYRSDDGGETWRHLGLADTRQISNVIVHPDDPDLVYVAALGHAWGPNEERGIFRSRDGGSTWDKVLYMNEDVGAGDLEMDPSDSNVLYAGMWQARRYAWGLRGAGPGTGLYKSTDGGDTWQELTNNPGLPTGENRGRIGVTVSGANPDRVWTIIEAENDQTGVFRSDDAGESWELVSQRAELLQRPWYYHRIHAHPTDPDRVYVQNTRLWHSTDGGRNYEMIPIPHGDSHDLWIDPNDPERMIEANDGGGNTTFNGGNSWSSIYNQPTAQFYHVTVDNRFPYRVYGNQQDNSTLSIPSRSDTGEIDETDLYTIGGGEDGYTAVHPEDPDIIYSGDHHWLTRYDHRTKQVKFISPWNEIWWGWGAADHKYRFQWVFPVVISPHDPEALYATSQVVHRSRDRGDSWEVISPDLTRADPSTLETTPGIDDDPDTGPYWGPIKRDNTGIEWYATIFAFAESPVQKGVFWAGSDDGKVHISRDDGESWQDVTPGGFPDFTLVSIIEPSSHEAGTAYLAANRYKLDDLTPYLFKTTDYGDSWTLITDGITVDDFTRVIREDPARPGLLYAGTETGLYLSFDDGGTWRRWESNFPVVPVRDMVVKDDDLVIATHGRSFWIFDDLAVLRQAEADVFANSAHLFQPEDPVRFREGVVGTPLRGQSPAGASGDNPPAGAVIWYHLEEPGQTVTLTFRDADGTEVATFSSVEDPDKVGTPRNPPPDPIAAEAGLNRFVWDLRYPGPLQIPGAIYRRYDPIGPIAAPGRYEVEMRTGGFRSTQSFELLPGPRLDTTQEEFDELNGFLVSVRDEITSTHETVNRIRNLRERLEVQMDSGGIGTPSRRDG
ncbi:MAG: WD40/YVTN/BNR-like repeat-containing protein, partial [Woeseiaceae bacterium]